MINRISCDQKEAAMNAAFELGLNMFGDITPEARAGNAGGAQQRLAEILRQRSLPIRRVSMSLRSANTIG